MGNHVSFDVGGGAPIEEVIAYRPSGPLPPLLHRSNLKAWRFFASAAPLEVKSDPIDISSFSGFVATDCYILLHIYRRHDSTMGIGTDPHGGSIAAASGGDGNGFEALGSQSLSAMAATSGRMLSPRGLSAPFSGYDDCGPYPFEEHGDGDGSLAHDIYIWNGQSALALTKAVALTKCFELERALINDEVGAIRHLHRGMGHALVTAAARFRTDYISSAGSEENHLLATLSKHANEETIQCRCTATPLSISAHAPLLFSRTVPSHLPVPICCVPVRLYSSLLSCMVPGLSSLSSTSFPELHKALFSHLKPQPLVERDLGSAGMPASPMGSASAIPAASLSISPTSRPPLPPAPSSTLPCTTDTVAPIKKSEPWDLSTPRPYQSTAEAAPSQASSDERTVPTIGVPKLVRPGSAGTNGFKLPGIGSIPRVGVGDEPSQTPRGAPPSIEPLQPAGGLPPTTYGLGSAAGPTKGPIRLNLSGLCNLSNAGDSADVEPDETASKIEKLRYFSKQCSCITPDLFLGADPVARNLGQLRENGITRVLNTAGVACANYHEGTSELKYKCLHLYDSPQQDISPVLYSAVEFIDDAIQSGEKVFVHCHQGVSRSSSMVIAYLMWKEKLSFNDAFHKVKALRGVANPNAGFICRLLALQKDITSDAPPSPARLYRMAPDVGGPSARAITEPALTAADLDGRTSFVLHGVGGLYIWHGSRSHPAYSEAARLWAAQLVKFEHAVSPIELDQASEDAGFWEMLGGERSVASRLPMYDGDYGVGKTPVLPPPETVVSLPDDPSPSSASSRPATLIPGVHTTAPGDSTGPLQTPRGVPPSMDLMKPPPTPRGQPDEPLPTPRGRPAADDADLEMDRTAKKPREEDESMEGQGEEPHGELYSFPDWENLSMFDTDDLHSDGVFALLCYASDRKTPKSVMMWVGEESDWVGERDSDTMELVSEFLIAKGLPNLPGSIVHQSEEEPDFWDYFVNG